MLIILTIVTMLVVAYAAMREGLFTAITVLVNVVLSGIVAFNFFEPISDFAESYLRGDIAADYIDFFVLVGLFCGSLALLRMATNNLANYQIQFNSLLQQIGAAAVGLLTGYLASGFLVCLLETLPWHRNFADFQPRSESEAAFRRIVPADRVWLAMMRHAGAYPFARGTDREEADTFYDRRPTFDRGATFELRYLRNRRFTDTSNPLPYLGEFDHELKRGP